MTILEGIELAMPDEWYIAAADVRGRFLEYEPIVGTPCVLLGYDDLDCFMVRDNARNVWITRFRCLEQPGPVRLYFGPSGFLIGAGWTEDEAISNALASLSEIGYDRWLARMCGWLDTHPLSPRYKWAIGLADSAG